MKYIINALIFIITYIIGFAIKPFIIKKMKRERYLRLMMRR
jgi:hypothetical protein